MNLINRMKKIKYNLTKDFIGNKFKNSGNALYGNLQLKL